MKRFLLLVLAAFALGFWYGSAHAEGYRVIGAKVTTGSPAEVRWRGVNKAHADVNSYGLKDSGATVVRWAPQWSKPAETSWATMKAQTIDYGMVPIVSNWSTTCKSDPASLAAVVDTWIAQKDVWTRLNTAGVVNIANEWGPQNSQAWADGYIAAIPRMRDAGYTGLLMVDSGGCGQDAADVVKYGASVLAADPLHNVVFDIHVYGGFTKPAVVAWQQDYDKAMAALKASGLPIFIGEFGPGRGIPPSPTMITPETIIATAEANGWGWAAWAYDDGACPKATDYGFNMVWTCWGDADHQGDANLNTFGHVIVDKLRSLNH